MRTISVLDILEETVRRYPDKTAVMDEKECLTYEMLLSQAKLIGYSLHKELQGQIQKPVVLFMEKSCKCIAAMLGTLYSGNIYVPMDIKTPAERMASILKTLGDSYVISSSDDRGMLAKAGYQKEALIYEELIEKWKNSFEDAVLEEIRESITDVHLMYILFTSGSTGVPKGVAIMHRSVVDYVEALAKETDIDCNDILGNQAPFYADMSLKDIYVAIKTGAMNCIIPQKYFMMPKKLLNYLDEKKVTTLMWVPTAYRIIAQFDALSKIKPKHLKRFWFSGEVMPVSVFKYWRKFYPDGKYAQLYGPTEITGTCTFFNVACEYGDEEMIPIGKPLENTGILLLDENDKEIRRHVLGVPGEICVFGSCLAAGYYNDWKRTNEVFVQNPLIKSHDLKIYRTGDLAKWDEEGNLVFVSRKDYQIKHAGKRVELGEIEAAIQSIKDIKGCCCVHGRKKDVLVLFYIGEIDAGTIMKQVHEKLPKYMIPQVYRKETQLPVLPNGKLDRKLMDSWVNEAEKINDLDV